MAYVDIIIFALVALFVGYRLWMVLGTHDARKPVKKKTVLQGEEVGHVVRSQAKPERIQSQATPSDGFDEDGFIQGAHMAFRTILEAYAQGDKKTLSKLLSPDMVEAFSTVIDKRKKKGEILETNLYRIIMTRILERSQEKEVQKIKVKFVSEQCVLIKDKDGNILHGDPSSVEEITDIWTFERDARSANPNWTLVKTEIP